MPSTAASEVQITTAQWTDLIARVQRAEASAEASAKQLAERDLAEARADAVSQKLYPAQRNTVTPKWNMAENIRRSVVEPFGAELQGLRFDSQQLQDALEAARALTVQNTPEEFLRALTIVQSSADTLHTNIQRELEATRLSLLIIDELRLSHSRARSAIKSARDLDHWGAFANDDARREHIAFEVEAAEDLKSKAKNKFRKVKRNPNKNGNVTPAPPGKGKRRRGSAKSRTKRVRTSPSPDVPADPDDAGAEDQEEEPELAEDE